MRFFSLTFSRRFLKSRENDLSALSVLWLVCDCETQNKYVSDLSQRFFCPKGAAVLSAQDNALGSGRTKTIFGPTGQSFPEIGWPVGPKGSRSCQTSFPGRCPGLSEWLGLWPKNHSPANGKLLVLMVDSSRLM